MLTSLFYLFYVTGEFHTSGSYTEVEPGLSSVRLNWNTVQLHTYIHTFI